MCDYYFQRAATWLFMNFRPSRASCCSLRYMRRQILVAAANFGQCQPKGFDDHPAVVADFARACRSFVPSDVALRRACCGRFRRCGREPCRAQHVRIASAMLFSSMLA